MLTLWLLRHAKSAPAEGGQSDFTRRLAPRGRKACRIMAGHMVQAGIQPDIVLCSTAARTRETWDLISRDLPQVPPVRLDDALYLAPAPALLRFLQKAGGRAGSLMLVGHNPGLEDLAAALAGSARGDALIRLNQKFPTAGLAELQFTLPDWTGIGAGAGRLVSFETPARLEPDS